MVLCFIGTGYVGLVSGTCFADLGNTVICVDKDSDKIDQLNQGKVPFYEQGLVEKMECNYQSGRLSFTTDIDAAIMQADIIFSAVGTPSQSDGSADLMAIWDVVNTVSRVVKQKQLSRKIYVTKSTVPVGTGQQIIDRFFGQGIDTGQVAVVSNPEFLREGTAVYDFFHPDRIVLGSRSELALAQLSTLYDSLYRNKKPVITTSLETAELAKYAANSFLATKISFMNEMAQLCEVMGADIQKISEIMGKDGRIGPYYLHPGPGYGGSCFPKDTRAIIHTAAAKGVDLQVVKAVEMVNDKQKQRSFKVLQEKLGVVSGKTVAVLGVSFKPNTDDIRESSTIDLVNACLAEGVAVRIFDPEAMANARQVWGDDIYYATDSYDAAHGADAVIVMTEWNMFRDMNLEKLKSVMKGSLFLDFRNLYTMDELTIAGFEGYVLGRGSGIPFDKAIDSILE
jgi:UDPglucose 6-dehydrogenase